LDIRFTEFPEVRIARSAPGVLDRGRERLVAAPRGHGYDGGMGEERKRA